MKMGFQSQKGDSTTLSTRCKRWPREKSRKLFIWWYIYYDGSQYKDIYIFYVKYLMTKYWWVTSYEFVERIIYLKRCSHTPMLMNSTYWVISPPFISPYKYIRGNIEVGTHGRQQLWIILWNWAVYYGF